MANVRTVKRLFDFLKENKGKSFLLHQLTEQTRISAFSLRTSLDFLEHQGFVRRETDGAKTEVVFLGGSK